MGSLSASSTQGLAIESGREPVSRHATTGVTITRRAAYGAMSTNRRGFEVKGFRIEHAVAAVILGALFLLLQDLAKDEAESWLKRKGMWPA